ncbi:MAG: phosphoribosylamine--glycine ligase [candidate division Zixibacteria bacterium]|nr:phosphoribosylamine--glycine ligase [candidate division Zixibacteria bacterium]MBU1470981.1 phosphoribosylamine--glycine ligase [candidate division Zixibacteria bacterium]
MKILVVGSGGREHAICHKLSRSRLVKKIYCAPGNAGIAEIGECVPANADNINDLVEFAERERVDLTVVGPEQPLTSGIVDTFVARGLRIFGPTKEASVIEGSKAFAKEFMRDHHIPTAPFRIFEERDEAHRFCAETRYPLVIKADGLAAGKGAIIVNNVEEARETIDNMMVEKVFGEAGNKVVIEDKLIGEEVTVMAFTDGETILPMLPSQDHKPVFDGDQGPNTGGMGAYCPVPFVSDRLMVDILDLVLEPTVRGLKAEGRTFKGILYAGLMINERGPKVIEFNCRFGDPETQVVLPLLENDLAEIFISIADGNLSLEELTWKDAYSVCVIMASEGYPGSYVKGKPISGLHGNGSDDSFVFHAGTERFGDQTVTNGGRVLGVTKLDANLHDAIAGAYEIVQKIGFDGAFCRKDIGQKATRRRSKLTH